MRLSLILIHLLYFNLLWGQSFKEVKLSSKERQKVKCKYKSVPNSPFASVELTLYSNHLYSYDVYNEDGMFFSNGHWRIKNDTLILKNSIDRNNVPIKIKYNSGEMDSIYLKTRVRPAIDLKGNEITNTQVFINADSISCYPFMGDCNQGQERIDSIKVALSADFQSRWIRIETQNFKSITPIVEFSHPIKSYLSFDVLRFHLHRGGLIELLKEN